MYRFQLVMKRFAMGGSPSVPVIHSGNKPVSLESSGDSFNSRGGCWQQFLMSVPIAGSTSGSKSKSPVSNKSSAGKSNTKMDLEMSRDPKELDLSGARPMRMSPARPAASVATSAPATSTRVGSTLESANSQLTTHVARVAPASVSQNTSTVVSQNATAFVSQNSQDRVQANSGKSNNASAAALSTSIPMIASINPVGSAGVGKRAVASVAGTEVGARRGCISGRVPTHALWDSECDRLRLSRVRPLPPPPQHLLDLGNNKPAIEFDHLIELVVELWRSNSRFPCAPSAGKQDNAHIHWFCTAISFETVYCFKQSLEHRFKIAAESISLYLDNIGMNESHKMSDYDFSSTNYRIRMFVDSNYLVENDSNASFKLLSEFEQSLLSNTVLLRTNFVQALRRVHRYQLTLAKDQTSKDNTSKDDTSKDNRSKDKCDGKINSGSVAVQMLEQDLVRLRKLLGSTVQERDTARQQLARTNTQLQLLQTKCQQQDEKLQRFEHEKETTGLEALHMSLSSSSLNMLDDFPPTAKIIDQYKQLMKTRLQLVEFLDEKLGERIRSELYESEAFLFHLIREADEAASIIWNASRDLFRSRIQEIFIEPSVSTDVCKDGYTNGNSVDFGNFDSALASFCRKHHKTLATHSPAWKKAIERFRKLPSSASTQEKSMDAITGTVSRYSLSVGRILVEMASEQKQSSTCISILQSIDTFFEEMVRFAFKMRFCLPQLEFVPCQLGQEFDPKWFTLHYSCAAISPSSPSNAKTRPPLTITTHCFPPIKKVGLELAETRGEAVAHPPPPPPASPPPPPPPPQPSYQTAPQSQPPNNLSPSIPVPDLSKPIPPQF
jgi:hypothetical protein